MEGARDLALQMEREGRGKILDQFANPANPAAHVATTGPEIWRQSQGRITHFVSSMGTTGTIVGVSRYLKSQNPNIKIIGLQPASDAERIPGIRRWPEAYLPKIFDDTHIDEISLIRQSDAEQTMAAAARRAGLFAGVSSGGALWAAITIANTTDNAVVVAIVCDRGDRYLSTGVYG